MDPSSASSSQNVHVGREEAEEEPGDSGNPEISKIVAQLKAFDSLVSEALEHWTHCNIKFVIVWRKKSIGIQLFMH